MADNEKATEAGAMVRVWDPLVRISHWVFAVCFAIGYFTEGEPEWLHVWSGYLLAAVVVIRIVWGFVGPRRARFSDFVTGPGKVFAYLRDLPTGRVRRHVGHSPAGGAMTVALLIMLSLTAVSGMATLAQEEGEGPLAGYIVQTLTDGSSSASVSAGVVVREHDHDEDHEGSGEMLEWKEFHEVAVNLTLILVLLHLAGVALASYVHRENLPRSMITGMKRR